MATIATSVGHDPLVSDSTRADTIAAFKRVLERENFSGAAVPAALGTPVTPGPFHLREDLPLYLRRLATPTPINTLVKLFVLDQWLDEDLVRRAVAPLDLDDLRALGLVERDARGVHAPVRLSGYRGLVLAHDRYDEQAATLSHDYVLDVNPTTVRLANLLVQRPARTALDVGTGCGVLALLLASHTDHVVAVDTNPRALNFAAFNARLNGLAHAVECRLGSLFEPVAGERFDLIACNPPYVISPDSRYIFRDGGRRGDSLGAEIAGRLPEHLADGGFASMLCNWGLRDGERDWSAPLRAWVDGSGCDTWLLHGSTQDPLAYAALWNRSRDAAAYAAALDRWSAYFEELGFASLAHGAIVMRRRTAAKNWIRADKLPDGQLDLGSAHIQRIFETETYLSSIPDDRALLQVALRTTTDHRLQQTWALGDGEYVLEGGAVELDGGLRFQGTVDPYTTHLLARCDGRRTLGAIAVELTEKGGLARDRAEAACAAVARKLASLGFLVPVG